MGLDMYLRRTKRVEGFSSQDYTTVSNAVYDIDGNKPMPRSLDLEAITGLKGANEFLSEIHDEGIKGSYVWKSFFTEVGYWRKANQIHGWFIDHVQGGQDDCGKYEVTQDHLEDLLYTINQILTPPNHDPEDIIDAYNADVIKFDRDNAERLLPTTPGFFFGQYEYDEYYLEDLEHTVKIIEKVLATTDFEKQILFYHSSW